MSLRLRLTIALVAVHVALSALVGAAAWWWLDDARRQQAESSARSIGQVLARGGFSLTDAVLERMQTLTGYRFRVLDIPEPVAHGTVQVVEGGNTIEIDYRTAAWQAGSAAVVRGTAVAALGGSAVFALLAWLLARQFSTPIERLAAAARRIGDGAWNQPVPVVGAAEIASLASDLEQMRQRLSDLNDAHRRQERLATLGVFTATIAHEVRNPLSAIRLGLQLIDRQHPGMADMTLLHDEIERLDLIVDELLGLSRGITVRRESIELDPLVHDVCRLLHRQAEHAGVTVQIIAAAQPVRLLADALRVRQVLMNLLLNAVQAAQQAASSCEASVTITLRADGFTIDDNGPGVDPALVPHLFEAFATGKPNGTGLGLHVAKTIVDAHGGTITHRHRIPGASFEVRFG